MEQTVDDVVIIANGHLVRQGTIDELHGEPWALVRSSEATRLAEVLSGAGLRVEQDGSDGDGALRVQTADLARVGDLALTGGAPVHELRLLRTDLERLFFQLTQAPENRNRNLDAPTSVEAPR